MALPERDGIPPSRVYLPEGPWERLLDFLEHRFPRLPPDILLQRLAAGEIVDEQGRPQTAGTPYRPGQWLWYYREVPDEVPVPFELPVIYRDARIVAVDKPHFMATTPGGRYLRHTALVRLRAELDLPTLAPMHRLDRDTAGVLLFSTGPAYRGRYQTLFQSRDVLKEYEAVAAPPQHLKFPLVHRSRLQELPGRFIMEEVAGEANSETQIELLQWLDDDSRCGSDAARLPPEGGRRALLRLLPLTGRKHQLRAHLSAIGMPILNDAYYPEMRPRPDGDFEQPLQLLARAIEFRDPVDGRMHRFESARVLSAARP